MTYTRPTYTMPRSDISLWRLLLILLAPCVLGAPGFAQKATYDPSWYEPARQYVKVAVAEDGVYRITGADLINAGVSIPDIAPGTLRLLRNGKPIPLSYTGDATLLTSNAEIMFVGQRNRGTDESWAYNTHPDWQPDWQSSTFHSLYTDTTYYWLSWGDAPSPRYQNTTSTGTGTPTSTFRDTLRIEDEREYFHGVGNETENPFYLRGEGFYTNDLRNNSTDPVSRGFNQRLTGLVRGGNEDVEIAIKLKGKSNSQHRIELLLETVVGGETAFRAYDEVSWEAYDYRTLRATVPESQVRPNNRFNARVSSYNEFDAPVNATLIDYITTSYLRTLALSEGSQRFAYSQPGDRQFSISEAGTDSVYVFSLVEQRLYRLQATDGVVQFSDRTTVAPFYWAVQASAVRSPAALSVDQPSDWNNASNRADMVIVTPQALTPSAAAFAEYRRSHDGLNVILVDIQDIYDQFDYGRPTPIAIRRFVHRTQQWSTKPRFMVMWGDALYANRSRLRPEWEVISYGQASSDGWFAMQLNGRGDWTESTAIGRIPIRTNEDGALFLQKVQTYDAVPLEAWQKRMIMMAAGRDSGEQRRLENDTNRWAGRAVTEPTGMDSLRFYTIADPDRIDFDRSFQEDLRKTLKEGTSWLCYFGHSAATSWDIVTDPPAEYDNAGRLPIALSLGCRIAAFAGGSSVNTNFAVLAEQLVVGSLNGAIAHWGTSGLGSVSAAARMGDEAHELVFADTMRVIGPIFQEVKRRYAARSSFSLRDHVQFGLIGDPSTRLAIPTRPDLLMQQSQMRIEPEAPVPADSTVTVTATLRNLGLVPGHQVTVQLAHTAPDGTVTPFLKDIDPFALDTEISFIVPIDDALIGSNRFTLQLDPDNVFDEESEANNMAERTHVIFSRGISLIAPRNLGALTQGPVQFRTAFTPLSPEGTPVSFELDTIPTFDSPALKRFETVSTESFAVWNLAETLPPGMAYYWRARVETSDGLAKWQEASFFIQENTSAFAWQQAGSLFDLNQQGENLTWTGEQWVLDPFDLEVEFTASRNRGIYSGRFRVAGFPYEDLTLGYGVLGINGQTGEVRASNSFITYERNNNDPTRERTRLDSLLSAIPEDDYIFIRTRHLSIDGSTEITEDVKNIFRSLGSTAIDTLDYNDLWLLSTRKGHPEETREWTDGFDPLVTDILQDTVLTFQSRSSITTSPRIGPARAWQTLDWEGTLPNAASEISLDVLNGTTNAVLAEDITAQGSTDLSFIDAATVPFLRLRATLSDSTAQATPQLVRWSIDFTSTPELAVDGSTFMVSADSVQEGASLSTSASVLNLSDVAADTVVITLYLTDAANNTTLVGADTLLNLAPNSTALPTFDLNTGGLVGLNKLKLDAVQPGLTEAITFNNTALAEFTVLGDQTAPTLEVTIDGQSYPNNPNPVQNLQDPSIPQVPPRPTIEIAFADENGFKPLQDTTLAIITLDEQRLAFASSEVEFIPATSERNEARIIYTPDFTGETAVHTLRVRVFDVAGNEAEGSPYQVHFRVQTIFSMGSLYPYPNPMNNFTRFAFLLQGADPNIIDDLRIRIYTLTGRVVKDFDLVEDPSGLEGGAIRIGWNKLFWDVTDEDGDPLAPGVYLYKVFMTAEGEAIPVNNEAGLEKLVVIR